MLPDTEAVAKRAAEQALHGYSSLKKEAASRGIIQYEPPRPGKRSTDKAPELCRHTTLHGVAILNRRGAFRLKDLKPITVEQFLFE